MRILDFYRNQDEFEPKFEECGFLLEANLQKNAVSCTPAIVHPDCTSMVIYYAPEINRFDSKKLCGYHLK